MQKVLSQTVKDSLESASFRLEESNIEDSRLNAELLLCGVLNCDRLNLYLNFDKPLKEKEAEDFERNIERRIRREPLQYITGSTNFFGYDFILNESVLIPRPETEILVEKVLQDVKNSEKEFVYIFEIGTGSGCIAVSLAKEIEKLNKDFKIVSIDKSPEALITARKNAEENSVDTEKVVFLQKDIFEIQNLKKGIDYIVSNPPYISKDIYQNLDEELMYEPQEALTDNCDGLTFYKKIIELAAQENFEGKVFCEIGFGQKLEIESLIAKKSFSEIQFFNDLNGIERIIKVVR